MQPGGGRSGAAGGASGGSVGGGGWGGIDASRRGFVLSLAESQSEPAAGIHLADDGLVNDDQPAADMDVTLSELLASFMESPLVLWVSARVAGVCVCVGERGGGQ